MCHSVILLATSSYAGARSRVPQFLRELRASTNQGTLPVDSISLLKSPENGNLLLFRLANTNCMEWGLRLALAMPRCAQHLALAWLPLWGPWLGAQGLCLHWNLSFLLLMHCLWCS